MALSSSKMARGGYVLIDEGWTFKVDVKSLGGLLVCGFVDSWFVGVDIDCWLEVAIKATTLESL